MATFFRQFSDEENKKSKQIGQEKVALTITGAGVVARKLTFSNNISELLVATSGRHGAASKIVEKCTLEVAEKKC